MTIRTLVASTAFALISTTQLTANTVDLTIFGIDNSGSSTFIADQSSANKAADYVREYISGLTAPHNLRMVSVGDVGLAKRSFDVKFRITKRRKSKPRVAAAFYARLIRSLPKEVAAGNITVGNTTSIISFFHSMKRFCAKGARLILFTDGVEFSADVNGQAFVTGKAQLPKPKRRLLAGCHVQLHGIGSLKSSLRSDGLERRLIPQWERYLTNAGATSVVVNGSFFN